MSYYNTDPNDPEAPVLLERYNGLSPGDAVEYVNDRWPGGAISGPLVLTALYDWPEHGVSAILNDGEWEVDAVNLRKA